jgi:hypothetical protein
MKRALSLGGARALRKAIVAAAIALMVAGASACNCTPMGTVQSDGTFSGQNCLASNAPPCCGDLRCRGTTPASTVGVCLPKDQCVLTGFSCGTLDRDGTPVRCCGDLRCLFVNGGPSCQPCRSDDQECSSAEDCCAGLSCRREAAGVGPRKCLPPIRCHGAPGSTVQPGQNCCDAMGDVSLVCPGDTTGGGAPCVCPSSALPCATGGQRPEAGVLCCAGFRNVLGVCCAQAGSSPATVATPCCFGSALNTDSGQCVACVPYLGTPNVASGETCCPALTLVDGVCQQPCVAMGSCLVPACDGVFVPGTFDSCTGAGTCVPDPSVVVCRVGDETMRPEVCGRRADALCRLDSQCAPPRLCRSGICSDWLNAGPNAASHTCWLATDRGRLICTNGRRLNCGLGTEPGRPPCPSCQ